MQGVLACSIYAKTLKKHLQVNMLSHYFNLAPHQRRWLMQFFIVMLVIGLAVALSPSPDKVGITLNDKVMHIFSFFAYAALFDMASSRSFWRFQVPILLAYGVLIEILQSFTTWRSGSLLDFVADAAGILLYWLLLRVLLKVKPAY